MLRGRQNCDLTSRTKRCKCSKAVVSASWRIRSALPRLPGCPKNARATPSQPAVDVKVASLRRSGYVQLEEQPTVSMPDNGDGAVHIHLKQHPILQLILQRTLQGSRPGARAPGDRFKLGLVVEGGGMRGIVSGAMLMALHALGLRDAFDATYGASAGAINLTYFLTGQRYGLDIYTEDLVGDAFINLPALLRGGPAMNLDYLIDYVMHDIKPLDWKQVIHSPLPLKVVASSLDSLQSVVLDSFDDQHDLIECLKASATVPQIAGLPRYCRGHRLVDAALFEPVPFQTAVLDGCTHVLVLCTRPATVQTTWRKVVRGTVVRVVKRTILNAPYLQPALNHRNSHQVYEQDEELVKTLAEPPSRTFDKLGAYVLPVYPEHVARCTPVTTDVATLKAAEAQGWSAIATLFGRDEILLDAVKPHSNASRQQSRTFAHRRPFWGRQ